MKRMIITSITALLLMTSCANNTAEPDSMTETSQAETTAAETTSEDTTTDKSTGAIPHIAVPDLSEYSVTDPFDYKAGTPEIKGNPEIIKDVTFFRDNKKICGRLYLPEGEGPFPVVVISSGQTASYNIYEDEASAFAESGCACIIFDFTGAVGRKLSDSELTESSVLTEVQDLNVILDSLSELPKIDTDNVFLWGHSLGGLVSTYTGGNRPDDIKGMILLEPSFTYPDYTRNNSPDLSQVPDVITDPKQYNTMVGKQFVIDMCSVDVMEEIKKCDKDVLIILGDADEKTSANPALGYLYPEIYETAGKTFPSSETVVINGADHIFQGESGKEAVRRSIEFIKKHT